MIYADALNNLPEKYVAIWTGRRHPPVYLLKAFSCCSCLEASLGAGYVCSHFSYDNAMWRVVEDDKSGIE